MKNMKREGKSIASVQQWFIEVFAYLHLQLKNYFTSAGISYIDTREHCTECYLLAEEKFHGCSYHKKFLQHSLRKLRYRATTLHAMPTKALSLLHTQEYHTTRKVWRPREIISIACFLFLCSRLLQEKLNAITSCKESSSYWCTQLYIREWDIPYFVAYYNVVSCS